MAGMEGFEPSSQGVWSRILDLNQYTVETVFKLIHRILLELILESPLPYRVATPLYIFPQLVVPIRPSRTPYLSAILYSLKAFRLKGVLIYLSSFKLLRNWSRRRESNPHPRPRKPLFSPLNYFCKVDLSLNHILSIPHTLHLVNYFLKFLLKNF